jgi:hypothetical protein
MKVTIKMNDNDLQTLYCKVRKQSDAESAAKKAESLVGGRT